MDGSTKLKNTLEPGSTVHFFSLFSSHRVLFYYSLIPKICRCVVVLRFGAHLGSTWHHQKLIVMEGFMSVFKSNCCSSRCEDDGGGHEKVDIAAYFNQVHSGAKAYSTFHASQPQASRAISMRLLIFRCMNSLPFVSCLPTMAKCATTALVRSHDSVISHIHQNI